MKNLGALGAFKYGCVEECPRTVEEKDGQKFLVQG